MEDEVDPVEGFGNMLRDLIGPRSAGIRDESNFHDQLLALTNSQDTPSTRMGVVTALLTSGGYYRAMTINGQNVLFQYMQSGIQARDSLIIVSVWGIG